VHDFLLCTIPDGGRVTAVDRYLPINSGGDRDFPAAGTIGKRFAFLLKKFKFLTGICTQGAIRYVAQ
jgi:hypothetical protein